MDEKKKGKKFFFKREEQEQIRRYISSAFETHNFSA